MTPLNNILNSCKLIYYRYAEFLKNHEESMNPQDINDFNFSQVMIKSVEHSGKLLYYYNCNQLQRMKICKNEFEPKFTMTKDPMYFIKKVIEPFQM